MLEFVVSQNSGIRNSEFQNSDFSILNHSVVETNLNRPTELVMSGFQKPIITEPTKTNVNLPKLPETKFEGGYIREVAEAKSKATRAIMDCLFTTGGHYF